MNPADQWKQAGERVSRAAERSGRAPGTITIVAVTKTVPWDRVEPLLQAGAVHLGENRVQEAVGKYAAPDGTKRVGATLHLLGHLQTNKAKKATALFDMFQSLDSVELARDLERHAADLNKTLDCLIEVKLSDEPTKSGLDPAALPELIASLGALPHLRLRGLMGIPPLSAQGDLARPYFQRLRRIFDDMRKGLGPDTPGQGVNSSDMGFGARDAVLSRPDAFTTLSMGMSSDFEIAIEEGATMVRLGTLLFGARNPENPLR